jgi:hypothetical protein
MIVDNISFTVFVGRTAATQEMVLDLRDQDPKDALRLLKCHLSTLSGNSCKRIDLLISLYIIEY